MSKKKGNFVEQHIDKIILGLIVLVCFGLLWIYILRNPFGPEIDRRKESPGSVQSVLEQKKNRLREKLDSAPSLLPESSPDFISAYQQVLSCSIPEISTNIYPLTPGIGSQPIEIEREYPVPEIPALQEVKVAYIRGAAYVPTEEVTPEMPYQNVTTKIGDLDFVTVSARLDVKRLVQHYQSCFMGLGVRHKDSTLASPVAAQVDLQRRVQLGDGSWSDWTTISYPQTEAYRKIFEKLPRHADQMPGGGIRIQMAQYKDLLKQSAVLQPRAYDFASSRYQYWMAPQYLKEAQDLLQQQRDEERRLRRETTTPGREGDTTGGERSGRVRPTPTRPTRPEPTRGRRGAGPDAGGYGPEGLEGTPIRTLTRQRTLEDVYRDFQKNLITQADWWTRNDPLLIWAHDDTIESGKTYQYRIRVGLFNPIAGKDWFRSDQQDYKNQVILWSPFALPEDGGESYALSIPKMLHIFPKDVVKDNPEAVEVKVSKYYFGRWTSHDFQVLPGQIVGSIIEQKQEDTVVAAAGMDPMSMEAGMGMPGAAGRGGMTGTISQAAQGSVDYTTNYLYLDVMEEVDWSGSVSALRRKEYSTMLYTTDGTLINKLPIKQQNWSADLKRDYRDVLEAERESEGEVLVPRSTQSGMMQTPGIPGIPGRGMPPRGYGGEGGIMIER